MRFNITILLLTLVATLSAHTEWKFKQVSIQDGLSSSTARSIYRDYRGSVWIGTINGLNKFNGHTIVPYYHTEDNTASIRGNFIYFVKGDKNNNLWISTNNGLCTYDYSNDTFVKQTTENSVYWSCIDYEDGLIFCGHNHLLFYNVKEKTFTRRNFVSKLDRNYISQPHHLLQYDKDNIIIASRWMGLFLCDLNSGKLRRIPNVDHLNITAMAKTNDKSFWIAVYDKGLYNFSNKGELLKSVGPPDELFDRKAILSLTNINNDELWVGTDGAGLYVYDCVTENITQIKRTRNPYSLPISTVLTIYQEPQGAVWLGSVREGAVGITNSRLISYNKVGGSKWDMSEKIITSIYEDKDNTLWIATDGNGVNRFYPATKTFSQYPPTFSKKVISITGYSDVELLISIYKEGVFVFDKQIGNIRPLTISANAKSNFVDGFNGVNVKQISKDKFLLMSDTVFLYDKNQPYNPINLNKKFNILVDASLAFAEKIENDYYLYGKSGIYKFTESPLDYDIIFDIFDHQIGTILSVAIDKISLICWIGTDTGLYSYNYSQNKITKIDAPLIKYVNSLKIGADNNLWIGTTSGLLYNYKYNENLFMLYGKADGMEPNELIGKASCTTTNQTVYMGGVNGFVEIKPELNKLKSPTSQLFIQDILIDKNRLNVDYQKNKISISPQHNILEFVFSISDESIFKNRLFRYRLLPIQTEFSTTNNPNVVFYNLDPNNYTLEVQYTLANGMWSDSYIIMNVKVKPYFWQTWWFVLILISVFVSILFIIRKWNLIKQQKKLNELIKHKDKELYEQKLKYLFNINHEIRTSLTLITAPLKKLLKKENRTFQEQDDVLNSISRHTKRMRNVIDMILDIRKKEFEEEKIYCSSVSLNSWLKDLLIDFEAAFKTKNIKLNFVEDTTITNVILDKSKTEMVLFNLLSNALKFTPEDGAVEVMTRRENGDFIISVKDNGMGLNGVDPKKLFNRFYQGEHDNGGSGIGLSYSKMLVELQGGSIEASQNEDAGATFSIRIPLALKETVAYPYLPLQDQHFLHLSIFEQTDSFTTEHYANATVLLVEDEQELNDLMVSFLKEHYKSVISAKNGKEAADVLDTIHPDIIVSDVVMPVMDGFQLCQYVKSKIEISHIPIVLLTAIVNQESMSIGYKLGADNYLTKPFDEDILVSVIDNTIQKRLQKRERYKSVPIQLLPDEMTESNADETFMSKLLDIIQKEIANVDLDVDYMTDKMAVSRTVLYNKVKILTNMGVKDFINDVRIRKAKVLLEQTNLPIVEISERVGFSQQRYFSTVFKSVVGDTPTEYRRSKKND